MGQQQLILLVLATVIVGLAIVVGINAFSENSVKANYDAMMHDAMRIANDGQAWIQKPAQFGGPATSPASSEDFSGLTSVSQLGYSESKTAKDYETLNGCYTIAATNAGLTITANNVVNQNRVVVEVKGLLDGDVTLKTTELIRGGKKISDGTAAAAITNPCV
jgi:hypothetical protein